EQCRRCAALNTLTVRVLEGLPGADVLRELRVMAFRAQPCARSWRRAVQHDHPTHLPGGGELAGRFELLHEVPQPIAAFLEAIDRGRVRQAKEPRRVEALAGCDRDGFVLEQRLGEFRAATQT